MLETRRNDYEIELKSYNSLKQKGWVTELERSSETKYIWVLSLKKQLSKYSQSCGNKRRRHTLQISGYFLGFFYSLLVLIYASLHFNRKMNTKKLEENIITSRRYYILLIFPDSKTNIQMQQRSTRKTSQTLILATSSHSLFPFSMFLQPQYTNTQCNCLSAICVRKRPIFLTNV